MAGLGGLPLSRSRSFWRSQFIEGCFSTQYSYMKSVNYGIQLIYQVSNLMASFALALLTSFRFTLGHEGSQALSYGFG